MLSMLWTALALQVTPVQPLPKGDALPPPGAEEAAVLAPINRMFAGLAAKDGAAIMAELTPDASGYAVVENPDGTKRGSRVEFAKFAAGVAGAPGRLEERLITPAIEIDGDIAMVWSPYVFVRDGKLSHCGIDHFSLVRTDGRWRIAHLQWTQRTTDCPAI